MHVTPRITVIDGLGTLRTVIDQIEKALGRIVMADPDITEFLQIIVETIEHVPKRLDASLTFAWSYSDNSMDVEST